MNTCMTNRDGVGLPQPGGEEVAATSKAFVHKRRFDANIVEFEMEKFRQ